MVPVLVLVDHVLKVPVDITVPVLILPVVVPVVILPLVDPSKREEYMASLFLI